MSDNTYLTRGADQYLAKEHHALFQLNKAWKEFTSSVAALKLRSVVEFDELTNEWKVYSPVKLPDDVKLEDLKKDPWGQPGIVGQSTYKLKAPSIIIDKVTDFDDQGQPKTVVKTSLAPKGEVVNADPGIDLDDENATIDYAFIVKDTNEIMKNAVLHNERTQRLVTYTNFVPAKKGKNKTGGKPVNEVENFRIVLVELLKQSKERKDDIKVQRILEGLVLRLKTLNLGAFKCPNDVAELTSNNNDGQLVNLQWLIDGYDKIEEVNINMWVVLDSVFKYYWSHHSPTKFYDGLYSFWRSNYPKTFEGRVASYFEDKSGLKRHLGKNQLPDRSKESKKAGGPKTKEKVKEEKKSSKGNQKKRNRSRSKSRSRKGKN